MKSKIAKILGVAISLAMLISMIVVPTSAGAETLAWSAERGPSTTSFVLAPYAVEIVAMAQSGDTILVATANGSASGANATYKSTNGGSTWTELTVKGNFRLLEMAPDDPNVFVALDNSGTLWYTGNGGATYSNLNLSSGITTVNAIDISAGPTRKIIAAGDDGTSAKMYKYIYMVGQSWTEEAKTSEGFAANQTSIYAAEFSPNYATDGIVVTVTANTSADAIMQVFWDESDKWNDDITGFTGYTETNLKVEDLASGASVVAASIAMPLTYQGLDEAERLVFIGLATSDSAGGVYRMTDNYERDLTTWNSGDEGPIYSVAYHDSGKLIAGDYDGSQVYMSLSPLATLPKLDKLNTLKQPAGTNKVTVDWYGDTAVCSTRGDETAFHTSDDDGYSWNGVSMIDTDMDVMNDYALTSGGFYLSTTDTSEGNTNYDTSLWYKNSGTWYKVYTAIDVGDTASKYLVRCAPEDNDAVYMASMTTQNVWVSKNAGMNSWKSIPAYKLTFITTTDSVMDIAVESADVAYVLGNSLGVSKTTNAGASWGTAKKSTEGMPGYSLTLAPNGDIIVGHSDGYVSVSQDGGSTFSRGPHPDTGNIIVACDDGYATNYLIYCADIADDDVRRAKVTSTAPTSDRFTADQITSEVVTGICQVEGVVYVTTNNGSQSYLYMSRKLETATTETGAEWSNIASNTSTGPGGTAAEQYTQSPNTLRYTMSSGSPKLYTIDTASPGLEYYTDAVALSAPTMNEPADAATIAMNPGSGRSYDITFIFERYSSAYITAGEIEIATDPDFNAKIVDEPLTIATDTEANVIGPYSTINAEFLPGTTYYWRVRTTTPMFSEWSETRSFSIESPETFAVSGPAIGSADVSTMPTFTWAEYEGAIKYEIAVSEDPTFAILEWSANVDNPFYAVDADNALKYSTTYYWRVRGVTAEPYLVGRSWVTPAGPWITGVFTTMAEAVEEEAAEPVVITEPGETRVEVIKVPVTSSPVIPTYLLWVIVGVGAILIIALIVLIVRTRRVA